MKMRLELGRLGRGAGVAAVALGAFWLGRGVAAAQGDPHHHHGHDHDGHHHHGCAHGESRVGAAGDEAGLEALRDSLEARRQELGKMVEDQGIYVETAKRGVELMGYVDASYAYSANGGGTTSGINGTPEAGGNRITGLDSQDFTLNSVRLHLAKHLPAENTWAAGFAVEMEFGEDLSAEVGHTHGDEEGGVPLPHFHEAMVEFRIPVGRGLDAAMGLWHSLTHYENDARPFNNHFTFGLLRTFLEPFEHTGLLLTYPASDLVTLQLGLANGWGEEDFGDSQFIDGADFAKMLTGRITVENSLGNARAALAFSYSFEGEERFGHPSYGYEVHEHEEEHEEEHDHEHDLLENDGVLLVHAHGTWHPRFAQDRLMLGANFDLLKVFDNVNLRYEDSEVGYGKNSATAWGVGLYSKYQFTDIFSLAARAEYLHSEDGTLGFADGLVLEGGASSLNELGIYATRADLWSCTLTAGFDIIENLLLRLEYRLDIVSSDGGGIDGDHAERNLTDNNRADGHTFAINVAYLFW
ncbi:MAG: outer membrane beta-barrel protein [Verrucomicrobiae bacterium]|nr:outer membrane beta-barrel protein [Verrucomicrobiae bacterium]